MKGKKTWLAAAIVGASAALKALDLNEFADALFMFGGALGLVGIGHKIEKRG